MATSQALEVKEKKEVVSKEEKTVPARYFLPTTDIYETDAALTVVMEIPGVEKKDIEVSLESDVLRVEARIDFSKYEGLEPLYTEYNRRRGRERRADAARGEGGAAAADRDQRTPCGAAAGGTVSTVAAERGR